MSHFRLCFTVIWTAALICITNGAPIEEKMLDRFLAGFKKCQLLDYVILPPYKSGNDAIDSNIPAKGPYNFAVPLEICDTAPGKDNTAVKLCTEAFEAIGNLSTCRNDIEVLKKTLQPPVKPINITVKVDKVCEEFPASQSLLVQKEEYVAFKFADKDVCPLICQGKVAKACAFVLWSYKVEAKINELSNVIGAEASPGSNHKPFEPKTKDSEELKSKLKELESSQYKTEESDPSKAKSEGPDPLKAKSDPSKAKSEESDPSNAKSEESDPSNAKSEESDPSKAKPEEPDPSKTKSEEPAPSKAKSEELDLLKAKSDPSNAKSEESDPSKAKPEEPNPSKTKSEEPDPSKAKSEELDLLKAKSDPSKAKPEEPDPSKTKSEEPDPSKAKPEEPNPSKTKSEEPDPPKATSEEPYPSKAKSEEPNPSKAKSEEPDPSKANSEEPDPSKANSEKPIMPASITNADEKLDRYEKNEKTTGEVNTGSVKVIEEKSKDRDTLQPSSIDPLGGDIDTPDTSEYNEEIPIGSSVENSAKSTQNENPAKSTSENKLNSQNAEKKKKEETPVDDETKAISVSEETVNDPDDLGSQLVGENTNDDAEEEFLEENSDGNGNYDQSVYSNDYSLPGQSPQPENNEPVTAKKSAAEASDGANKTPAKVFDKFNAGFPVQEDTHFFFYFVTIVIFAIGGYVLFHNKQKIFALIIEGRHERRRRSGASYRKLETK